MKKSVLICLVTLFIAVISTGFVFAFSVGKFTVSQINFCGNGIIADKEECDLANLGDKTCLTLGYSSGSLSCTSECTFNESQCVYSSSSGVGGDGGNEKLIRECNDGIDNDNDNLIDSKDPGCSNVLDNSESDAICDSDWQEADWGECIEEIQVKRIIDLNHCKLNYVQNETRACLAVDGGEIFIFDDINSFIWFLFFLIFCFISAYFLSRHFDRR